MKKTAVIALAAYFAPFAAWANYPEMEVSFVVPFPRGDIALGGLKQSGNGHGTSLHAFDKHFDLKTARIKV